MCKLERLRHRIAVYSKVEGKTEFGETTYCYDKLKTVWAEIIPGTGKTESLGGESIRADITHRVTTRKNAIKNPRNDMYFVFQGQRYEVLYFMPHYKQNDLIEFYCKLILEGDNDYGKQ